jgi:putative membrane protein
LINALGYVTIPATAFVAFLLTGFLEIGQEMYVLIMLPAAMHCANVGLDSENPFNYGLNDLSKFLGQQKGLCELSIC